MKKLIALLMTCMLLGGCNAPDYIGEVNGAKIIDLKRDKGYKAYYHTVVVEKEGNTMEFQTDEELFAALRKGNTVSFKYTDRLRFYEIQVDGLTKKIKE